jgi:hypothetical protein
MLFGAINATTQQFKALYKDTYITADTPQLLERIAKQYASLSFLTTPYTSTVTL